MPCTSTSVQGIYCIAALIVFFLSFSRRSRWWEWVKKEKRKKKKERFRWEAGRTDGGRDL